MPRSIWSGAISFGLVNVPIRLYPAVQEHRLQFHLVHEKDSSPIGYQKVCKAEEKPVPDDQVVKAFEISKGQYVVVTDEDFENARPEATRTIDILDFVPSEEIDPIYFARTYYLGPDRGGEKVYSLLARALDESGLVAVAKFVLRDKQHLAAVRVRDGLLVLEQLYFADEIRSADELDAGHGRVGKEELAMAKRLIESGATDWRPDRYRDTYRDELAAAIEAKAKGKEITRAPEVEEEEPVDLLDALRQSIERSKGDGRRDGSLSELSRKELDQRARKAGIEGRSKMSKDELVEALRAA
jgi:DNA end-binding protein Ku